MLERAGKITLPPVKYVRHNPLANRARPTPVLIDSTPITGALRELGPLEFQHLASHILGRMALRISRDWEDRYGHPLYFLETFVDPERFRGTCYYAANWVWLGETTGRGKASNSYVPNRSIKHILGYPLHPQFRELLAEIG